MELGDFPSLLILPPPPRPASRQSLDAAYRPPIGSAFSRLRRPEKASKLIVAVAGPILHGSSLRHKSFSWAEAQNFVASLYTVIAVICAQLSIPTDVNAGPGSVDATIILVDHNTERQPPLGFHPTIVPSNTVITDLATFTSAYHPWNLIFHVTSETGIGVFQAYLKLYEGRQRLLQDQLVPVPGGLAMNIATPESSGSPQLTETRSTVCLGGTFDHLHPGHKLLLTAGALLLRVPEEGSSSPCQYIIGVAGDELLKNKKYAEYLQPWSTRARNILYFLSDILGLSARGWGGRLDIVEREGDFSASFRDGLITVNCVVFQDVYGPTASIEDIDILVVSAETRSGGRAVNARRSELGFHPLEIYEVDVLDAEPVLDNDRGVDAEDFASKISSTAIRQQKAKAVNSIENNVGAIP